MLIVFSIAWLLYIEVVCPQYTTVSERELGSSCQMDHQYFPNETPSNQHNSPWQRPGRQAASIQVIRHC